VLDLGRPSIVDPSSKKAVKEASLIYTSDEEAGIRRKGSKDSFVYLASNGRKLGEGRTLARIRALAIPPAWTDVWICPHANGHLQATGRDQRGRKQYRYHPDWVAERDGEKFSSLIGFAEALPGLRAQVDADLGLRGLPLERVVASVVWLLDNTTIRIGNAAYARENKSFGLTTLRDRHVDITGSSLRFSFKGKSGKEWKLKLTDRRIAKVVRGAQELPGQHLFQYIDADGARRSVRSDDVNAYIRDATGTEFSSKHFRTWAGTVHAFMLLLTEEQPDSASSGKRTLNRVIEKVAERLGNTRAVCRRCYVHPRVIESWQAGELSSDVRTLRDRRSRQRSGLDEGEALLLRWLRKFG